MRKSALAAGAVLATGLVSVTGGTALASSGGGQPPCDNTGEDTKPSTTQPTNHQHHNVQAVGNAQGSLIGLNVPVALDLHEGIANDLNASHVVHDVIRVGDVVPTAALDQGGNAGSNGSSDSGDVTTKSSGSADAKSSGGGGAQAHAEAGAVAGSLSGSLAGALSSATATVNAVTNIGDITVSH